MILSLTPLRPPPSRTIAAKVSASRIRACRDPKKELGVIFPCEEDGDAVLRIARGGRRSFRPNPGPTSQVSPGFRSSMIFRRLALSPQFVLDGPGLFGDRHTPSPFQELEGFDCER
ncbi:hypothetical protein GWK47_051548 [Chionoecetes opilio]|uniref:Uncharacterized protein n=1 Tax=Chionoecetes opilio TaxID=41210 RepID=A0A8J4Y0P8_CHIOP|nr:hypothetical protein GWK47_051548 [Chionoecetes opilio]